MSSRALLSVREGGVEKAKGSLRRVSEVLKKRANTVSEGRSGGLKMTKTPKNIADPLLEELEAAR